MSIHKLTAGDGYTYLTRQVAAFDATDREHLGLEAYYTAAGEAPGVWMGTGLAGLADPSNPAALGVPGLAGLARVSAGDPVTEEQMRALFGEGRQPNADAIELAVIEAGGSVAQALTASTLGRPFRIYDTVNAFRQECAQEFTAYNAARGMPATTPVPDTDRARIRTEVGRRMFTDQYGRPPADVRELSAFVARASRPETTAVAGFDLTFSPVKSVSALWAVAPRPVAAQIEAAHHAAVADVLAWLERHVAYTRTGLNGIRQVEVRGVLAAAFVHRDSRAGDPDLHTHLVISNKVQTVEDGRWLAVDGRVLFKATVGLSERYNTRLEAHLGQRLGLRFTERPGGGPGIGATKRPVREVVGVDERLRQRWSSRREAVEARQAQLAEAFQADHGRTPTPVEALRLAQQAVLETREAKHQPRSLAEQRAQWRHQAIQVLGGRQALDHMIATTSGQYPEPVFAPTPEWVHATSQAIVQVLEQSRATWQSWHVRAEAERQARAAGIPLGALDTTVNRLLEHALTVDSLPLRHPDPIREPEALRRRDGASVYTVTGSQQYTSAAVLAAEQRLLAAATRHDRPRLPHHVIERALLESAANRVPLNPGQAQLVRDLATSGARLQLAIAPAGSGKTTAMRVLAQAWTQAGGTVIGLAPSAAAAAVLAEQLPGHTDTLTKLTHSLQTGLLPQWVRRIGPRTLVVIDEAGLAGTVELAHAVDHILNRGGSVRLVGDDHQLGSIAAGGILRDIAHTAGAATLTQLMRFDDPAEAAATLALRDGEPAAIGFYLDNDRIHIGDLTGVTDRAYRAWAADRAAGLDSILLAPTRQLVAELNARARTDRLTTQPVTPDQPPQEVTLADGNRASTGDVIITRTNRRDLPITPGQWVKNGDRWTITDTNHTGALRARHHDTARVLTLPADYVAGHTELGYATTIHTAEGTTATTCHTIATGEETRQLLYVALTRGTAANHLYLATGSDGDPHTLRTPRAVFPPTATDLITTMLARDGTQHSATTHTRDLTNPAHQLAEAAARYHDALGAAAEDLLGPNTRTALDTAAESVRPGLTHEPAYPTLRAHLALLAVSGTDPIATLTAAAGSRELATSIDAAAVLDWRLDPTSRRHTTPGPLPWLPAIPHTLTNHPDWGPYLTARATQVSQLARDIRDLATTAAPPPRWAAHLRSAEDHQLLPDLAVWRAATAVPDTDRRPTGPPQHPAAMNRHQQRLDHRVTTAIGDPHRAAHRWARLAEQLAPQITTDRYWPELATQLTTIHHAGIDATRLLTDAANQHPLPDDHPAAALWWRLTRHLTPAAEQAAAITLRPTWTPTLTAALGHTRAEIVLTDPAWPALVAAVTTTTRQGWTPEHLIHAATQLAQADLTNPHSDFTDVDLTHLLIWRIAALTDDTVATSENRQPNTEHTRSAVLRQPAQDQTSEPIAANSAIDANSTNHDAAGSWHDLAATLDRGDPAGHDVRAQLPKLATGGGLPEQQSTAELRYRLQQQIHTAHTEPSAHRRIHDTAPRHGEPAQEPTIDPTTDVAIDL